MSKWRCLHALYHDFLLSITLCALASFPRTPAISIWCGVFVVRRLWKPIITESGVPLSEFDFHAEKVCAGKCNSAELLLQQQQLPSVCARPLAPAARCRAPPYDVPPDRRGFMSRMNQHLSQASETTGQTKAG